MCSLYNGVFYKIYCIYRIFSFFKFFKVFRIFVLLLFLLFFIFLSFPSFILLIFLFLIFFFAQILPKNRLFYGTDSHVNASPIATALKSRPNNLVNTLLSITRPTKKPRCGESTYFQQQINSSFPSLIQTDGEARLSWK